MGNEFQSRGFIGDRVICYKHDVRNAVTRAIKSLLGRPQPKFQSIRSVSPRIGKEIVLRHKLAVANGVPSWFYTAFERGDHDPLTEFTLHYIDKHISRDARVLNTGCGAGLFAFRLADLGFREVVGVDLLPECIAIAKDIEREAGYTNVSFHVTDGLRPTLEGEFDVITMMHWVFSAWMGNYGNEPVSAAKAKQPAERERLLTELLTQYVRHLRPGGIIVIELTDAVADYRIATDHHLGERSLDIYPVRHTPEQVRRCAASVGLELIDTKLGVSYGHQPRTTNILRRPA